MSLEEIEMSIGLQDEQLYEYAFSNYNKFTITGNKKMICKNNKDTDIGLPYKCVQITVRDNEPSLENIIEFLRFAPISNLTHLDYTELVGEEYFFPKVDDILDYLKDRCPYLRSLNVQFRKNSEVQKVFSHYLFSAVNYKKLDYLAISMVLEDFGSTHLIEYCAGEYLNVNGGHIDNLNLESGFLFRWDETTHKPVTSLELYDCSFFQKLDIIYLLNLFKNTLLSITVDIEILPDIFFLYLDWCQSLVSLHINFKAKDSIESLMGMTNLRCLKELTFDDLHITARPLVMELFNHKSMKILQELEFNNCRSIDDKILKIIANNCVALQSLEIFSQKSWSGISDFGIMSVLYNCHSLTRLELDCIAGVEGYFLAFANTLFPQLEHFEITNCSIKSPVCQGFLDYSVYL